MSTERKGTELFVGLFLVIGFAVIGFMFVMFGRVGQGLTTRTYEITVEFPNASGLVKNADVLLAGARIGNVAEAPYLLVKDGFSVGVRLKVSEKVKIPRDAVIVVNQSGLLGDCYVEVLPPERIDPNNLIQPNEHVMGRNKPGLDVLQAKGADVLEKLASELDELEALTKNINQNLVNEQNTKNLQETFAHLKTMSSNLSESSKKLDGILNKGDSAVDSAKRTMDTVDKAAADLRTAMSDFKRVSQNANNTLDSAKNMLESGNRVLKKAEQGDGALGVLLSDKETAENLRSFAANLRRSGPVFYKDRGAAPTPAPRRR
jgi:phospholipid/cholesterol/gamma-HCH transport system substrate-binding protein